MKSCPLSTSCPRLFYFVDEKYGWLGQFRGRFSEQYYKEHTPIWSVLFWSISDYSTNNIKGEIMQNRYAGDIGDFGKLGLLRTLYAAGLSVGVNWYLNPNLTSKELNNKDGKFVDYSQYKNCDEQLYSELQKIINCGQRNVSSLENNNILQAKFYSAPLDFFDKNKSERFDFRCKWHENALKALSGVDVVFVDPDNGLIVRSAVGTSRANKYVEASELTDYYSQGASVIYYQHKARYNDTFYINRHKELLSHEMLSNAAGLCIKFIPVSQRYYFFIIQPRHRETIQNQIDMIMSSEWKKCFTIVK